MDLLNDFAATNNELASQLELTQVLSLEYLTELNGIFELSDGQLALHLLLDGKPSRLCFDLGEGEVALRANKVSKSNELIAKAIGCKPHYRPNVIDATAGMGRDALIMSMLGCQVVMQERNQAIYPLLKNALERYKKSNINSQSQLELRQKNSLQSFGDLENVDVIYLDPMFPERKKSALVKKEMRLFKKLAGNDVDSNDLMLSALTSGVKRIVVKRPKGAPCLADKKPSHEIKGKKFRFDVYLT